MRLHGDLRAVARLAGDTLDRDEAVGDLGDLELEQGLDQLRIAAREDDLRPLGAGADVADDRLDARSLLVALAVDLLRPRQQRLDLAEVDEDVPAVAGLLDDAGDHLADAVDVLVVHHLALGLADALQDDLLRRLRRDAAEVVGRHVLPVDEILGDLRPVDLEVVVGEERVVLLAGLLLDPLQVVERALARLVEKAHFQIGRNLDRVDAKVAAVVELDGCVPGCTRRLLVGRKQRVLERGDERAAFDSLLALDLANGVNDLLAHDPLIPSSTMLARTISSYETSSGGRSVVAALWIRTTRSPAETTSPRVRPVSVLMRTVRPTARSKCSRVRSGRSIPGEETSTVYSSRYGRSTSVTRVQRAWSTPAGWSTKTQNRSFPVSSSASTSTPGSAPSTRRATSRWSCRSF